MSTRLPSSPQPRSVLVVALPCFSGTSIDARAVQAGAASGTVKAVTRSRGSSGRRSMDRAHGMKTAVRRCRGTVVPSRRTPEDVEQIIPMRGLSLIHGLVLTLLVVLFAHADDV